MDEIFENIAKKRDQMSKTQRKIADYIISNQSHVPFLNITTLAKASGTSESSIVRFCTFLGYQGFPEFKNALQNSIRHKLSIRERLQLSETAYNNNNHSFLTEVFNNDINSIQTTLNNLDMDYFEEILRILLKAPKIIIVAYRSVFSIGYFLEYYLQMILGNTVMLSNVSQITEDEILADLDSDTVVLGITFHRYTKKTIGIMEYAYNRGCTTIAITDTLQSPVIPFSKYNLLAETRLPSMTETFAGPFSIVNAIIIYLVRERRTELNRRLEHLEKPWSDFDVFDEKC